MMHSGTTSFTSPAPLRRQDTPASEIAPAIPNEPPIKSARPKSPLWASGRRGGRRGSDGILVFGFGILDCLVLLHSNHPREVAGFKPSVNVHDANIGRARVQHAEQGRDATEAGAIA